MNKDYIIDDSGNLFIAINNKHNKFCYHVVVLQYLHSSKTLNNCLNKLTSNNGVLIDNIILPLKTYAKININNYKDIFTQLQHDYDEFIDIVVDDYAKNGYYPEILIFQVMMPVIYKLFPREFESICRELHIKKMRFTTMTYKIRELINKSPFVKRQYRNELYMLNINLINNIDKINFDYNYKFKCGILEVFPHVYDCHDGHALFIIKTDNYYIFDDSNFITNFSGYMKDREFSIRKISIRNIDDESFYELSKLWGKNILHKKINDRYELINENGEHEDIKTVEKNILILSNKNQMDNKIEGGAIKKINYWMIISVFLILILIIESIFAVIKYKNNKSDKFRRKCKFCK